jgi:hypothetical protein
MECSTTPGVPAAAATATTSSTTVNAVHFKTNQEQGCKEITTLVVMIIEV